MAIVVRDLDAKISFGRYTGQMTYRELLLSDNNRHMGYVVWLHDNDVLLMDDGNTAYFKAAVRTARANYVDDRESSGYDGPGLDDDDGHDMFDLSDHGDHD